MKIDSLLTSQNIAFVQKGKDYIISCLNPDHIDNNPSMRVDSITGAFHCFSCGHSGSIFKHFNVERNVLDYRSRQLLARIDELLLPTSLTMPVTAEAYTSDFRNISADTLAHFGAFTSDMTEEMDSSGRIIFPIKDITDNIISFQGRYLYSDASPKYEFYPSKTKIIPFPQTPELINNSVILVEGIFDMLNLYDKGLKNAVCTFGTSFGSSTKKAKVDLLLNKLEVFHLQGVSKFYIIYDNDEAGQLAADRLKYNLESHYLVENILLPEGIDPGSLSRLQVKALKEEIYGSNY